MFPDATVTRFLQETAPLSWADKKRRLLEFYEEVAYFSHKPFVLVCEFSGKQTSNLDAHHFILNDEKRWKDVTNTVLNMALVDHDLHIARMADNQEAREEMFAQKVAFWGREPYREWFEAWPQVFQQTRRPIWNMMERMLG